MLEDILRTAEPLLQQPGDASAEGTIIGLAAIGAGLAYCAINGVIEMYRSIARLGEEERKAANYKAPEAKRSQQI